MEQRKGFILESIKFAFKAFFRNFGLMALIMLIIIGIVVALFAVLNGGFWLLLRKEYTWRTVINYNALQSLMTFVLCIVVIPGLARIALDIRRTKKSTVGRMWLDGSTYVQAFSVSVLVGIGAVIGLVLFVIPGVIWIVRTQFALFFVVDQQSNAVDSIKKSWELTRGQFWSLLVWYVLSGFIGLFFLLFNWAFSALCEAYVYDYLRDAYGQKHEKFESMI